MLGGVFWLHAVLDHGNCLRLAISRMIKMNPVPCDAVFHGVSLTKQSSCPA